MGLTKQPSQTLFFGLPGATCILAPVSDCSLLICSPPRPMTEKGTKLPY